MLELTGDHIQSLNDEDLRELVYKLCIAELRGAGLPASGVTAGGNQTAADGGLDVRVEVPDTHSARLDFIQRSVTGFQVKCEDMQPAKLINEMRPGGELRPVIKSLIERSGAYIVVSSKGSVTDSALRRRVDAMASAVASALNSPQLKLDFYDRGRLAAWVRVYPGVEMWVRDRVGDRLQGWQAHGRWTTDTTGTPYLHDPSGRLIAKTSGSADAMSASDGIDSLRQKLRCPGAVIRLVGLSGTGKTRLVQALFEPGVGTAEPLDEAAAVYTDLGHGPSPSARDMLLRLGAAQQRAIVVVDNCNPETHRSLTRVVARHPKHLSLVTVEYDVADDEPEATDVYELAPATDGVLEEILGRLAPQVTQTDRSRIAEFSSGNARVALALARTLQHGETLGVLNDNELFRRLFSQNQGQDDGLRQAAEVLALVYSFDGEEIESSSSELNVLAKLADCSPRNLFRHVATLRGRDLVQARGKWRAVLPQALANRLAKAALENTPHGLLMGVVRTHERLLRSFTRRLGYLHDSPDACSIAAAWIEGEGWLTNSVQPDELQTALFFNLAPLVPEMALTTMEAALSGEQGKVFAAAQWTSFHRWLSLARSLAYEPHHFERAASIVLAFAEAEEERRTDCQNAWKELFHVTLSGTMASPDQRATLLRSLLQGDSSRKHRLAVRGAGAMLKCSHFSSSHNFSFGARPRGFGWHPQSAEAFLVWYSTAFEMVREVHARHPALRDAIRSALAAEFRSLWCHEPLHDQLVSLAGELAAGAGWPGGWVAVRNALRFGGSEMKAEQRDRLRQLEAQLAPKTLRQQILTYTTGHAAGSLDVADSVDEDDTTEDAGPVSAYERVRQRATVLGQLASQDDDVLKGVLVELLSAEHGRQRDFGVGVGRASSSPLTHWQLLYDAYVDVAEGKRSAELLSGFLQGARDTSPAEIGALLDSLISDPVLGPLFPYLHGWPRDDHDGDRLIRSIDQGLASAHRYHYGTAKTSEPGLSMVKFCTVARRIATMPKGLGAAIDTLATELHPFNGDATSAPEDLVALGRDLLAHFDFDVSDDNLAYRLKVLAGVCLSGEGGASHAQAFIARFAIALDDYRTRAYSFAKLACLLFKLQPAIALDAFLLRPHRRRRFPLRSSFDLDEFAMEECAPLEALQSWVEVEPAGRLLLVAAEVNILDKASIEEPRWSPLAERLLAMASDKGPVLQAFAHHFNPNGWSGSLGQALQPYVKFAERLASDESVEISVWAHQQLDGMKERIQDDQRRERRREESFE